MTLFAALIAVALVAGAALGAGWLAGDALARRARRAGASDAGVVWTALGAAGAVLLAGGWLVAPMVEGLLGAAVTGRLVVGLFLAVLLAFGVVPLTASLVARRVEHWRGRR